MSKSALSTAFYERMKDELEARLKPDRFTHSLGVSEMAVQLAETYGVDPKKARLAGLIHDWDKSYNDKEIRERARELDLKVDPEVFESMPRLLHGITAAAALHRDHPEIDDDIIQAIERHTSGHTAMSDLDMVVYIADVIECSRPYPVTDLHELAGKVSLEELFLQTYKQVFSHLVERGYAIHPDTVKVWNYYTMRARKREQNS